MRLHGPLQAADCAHTHAPGGAVLLPPQVQEKFKLLIDTLQSVWSEA
jgi:hypothetical protein